MHNYRESTDVYIIGQNHHTDNPVYKMADNTIDISIYQQSVQFKQFDKVSENTLLFGL